MNTAAAMPEVNFSDLLQHPTETVAKLEGRNALRVSRRGAEDLVLTTAARASQDHELVDVATRMFIAVMSNPVARSIHLLETLAQVFPWVRFLPSEERATFKQELIDVTVACKDLDTPAPVLQVIAEWRHTAEVYADPELFAAVRRSVKTDLGMVAEPQA